MSGHNKWSKIKHKKAATDAEKSQLFSKHSNLITIAAKKAGSDLNSPELIAAIDRAKKDAMPKENINRAVAKGLGVAGADLTEVLFETHGPEGVAILITAVTTNNNRTSQEIKNILSKHQCQLSGPGSALWAFSKTATGYQPNTYLNLSPLGLEKLKNLIAALSEHPDTQVIYTTAATLTKTE